MHELHESVAAWKASRGAIEIAVGIAMAGDDSTDDWSDASCVESVEPAEETTRLTKLEYDDALTRHTTHLGERSHRVVDIADAERDRRHIKRPIRKPQLHRVADFECDVAAAVLWPT